jgi:hypothetical protein
MEGERETQNFITFKNDGLMGNHTLTLFVTKENEINHSQERNNET